MHEAPLSSSGKTVQLLFLRAEPKGGDVQDLGEASLNKPEPWCGEAAPLRSSSGRISVMPLPSGRALS